MEMIRLLQRGLTTVAWHSFSYFFIVNIVPIILKYKNFISRLGSALGLKRDYHGILGKADRLIILTLFEYIMMFFIIVGNVTAVQMGIKTWRRI